MSIADLISSLKDIALAIAAGVTAYVAITGLNRWQKELSGKATFEVARDLARKTYLLRDELKRCRSPFFAANEFPEKPALGSSTTPDEDGKKWAHVYQGRWKPVQEAVQGFDAASLEAEALWGDEIRAKTDELRKCVVSLSVDIDAFISNKFSGGEDFKDRDFGKEVEAGIWETKPDKNQLSIRISSAIKGIEDVVRPHLARS